MKWWYGWLCGSVRGAVKCSCWTVTSRDEVCLSGVERTCAVHSVHPSWLTQGTIMGQCDGALATHHLISQGEEYAAPERRFAEYLPSLVQCLYKERIAKAAVLKSSQETLLWLLHRQNNFILGYFRRPECLLLNIRSSRHFHFISTRFHTATDNMASGTFAFKFQHKLTFSHPQL